MREQAEGHGRGGVWLSVVSPAHNEEDNLSPLVGEITAALEPLGIEYEVLVVDDGSTDSTHTVIRTLLPKYPRLRGIRMMDTPKGKGNGQSAAFHAGFRAARGEVIAVLDADLQNDPADLPAMLALMRRTNADMVQGDRSHARKDNVRRKFSSWVGRMFRKNLLGDSIRDTGCSLRVMKREVALAIPLEFRGMHRFIPVTARQMGFEVVETRVNHRPRVAGVAKYGMLDRAVVGLYDCFSVRWMSKRRRSTEYCGITNDHSSTCHVIASEGDGQEEPRNVAAGTASGGVTQMAEAKGLEGGTTVEEFTELDLVAVGLKAVEPRRGVERREE